MFEKYFKYPVLILYTIVLMSLFYTEYSNRLTQLPAGCDEFGYMNIAKAFSQGTLFKDHAERPFDKGLLEYLRHSSFDYGSYEYLICPHAYYLHKGMFRITNLYPPGTGMVLSVLPFDKRKTASPAVFALLLVFFLIFAFTIKSGKLSFLAINMTAVVAVIAFMSSCFSRGFTNYDTVNSVAPSFGILLAAGYLLDKKPGIAIALLGTSVLFRIANIIFIVPFMFIYLGKGISLAGYFSKDTMIKAIKAVGLFLAGGAGLYFLYVWARFGNPFSPTYPYAASEAASGLALFKNIPEGLSYYISFRGRWFMSHVLILVLMAWMGIFKKMPVKWIIIALIISLYNICFYLIHPNRTDYYLYGSAMIIGGILLTYVEAYLRNTLKAGRIVNYAGIMVIGGAALFSALRFPRQDFRQQFNDQIRAYNDCFSGYDVVWANDRSGTVEYATGKAAFRYQWAAGADNTRKAVMSWLYEHGYRQAIWESDLEKGFLDTVDVEAELKSISIDYTVKKCLDFGTVIEVR